MWSLKGATNETLLAKFNSQHQGKTCYKVPATKQSIFTIVHYAGKVKYFIQVCDIVLWYKRINLCSMSSPKHPYCTVNNSTLAKRFELTTKTSSAVRQSCKCPSSEFHIIGSARQNASWLVGPYELLITVFWRLVDSVSSDTVEHWCMLTVDIHTHWVSKAQHLSAAAGSRQASDYHWPLWTCDVCVNCQCISYGIFMLLSPTVGGKKHYVVLSSVCLSIQCLSINTCYVCRDISLLVVELSTNIHCVSGHCWRVKRLTRLEVSE